MTPVARGASGSPVVDGWTSDSLRGGSGWRSTFGPIAAGEAAAHLDRNGNRPASSVNELEFPALARLAAGARAELATGSGLVWIRPAFPDELDDQAWKGIFSLLGSLLGMAHRRIDPRTDVSNGLSMSTTVVDGLVPDVVGSVWLSDANSGQEVSLVSATRVHSELEDHEPQLVRALYRTVLHMTHRSDEGSEHEAARYVRAPVFRYERASRSLEFRYDRPRIELAHELSGRPLHPTVVEAFDLLEKWMALPHLVASVQPSRGDIVLAHNRRVASHGLVGPTNPRSSHESRALRVVNQRSQIGRAALS